MFRQEEEEDDDDDGGGGGGEESRIFSVLCVSQSGTVDTGY